MGKFGSIEALVRCDQAIPVGPARIYLALKTARFQPPGRASLALGISDMTLVLEDRHKYPVSV